MFFFKRDLSFSDFGDIVPGMIRFAVGEPFVPVTAAAAHCRSGCVAALDRVLCCGLAGQRRRRAVKADSCALTFARCLIGDQDFDQSSEIISGPISIIQCKFAFIIRTELCASFVARTLAPVDSTSVVTSSPRARLPNFRRELAPRWLRWMFTVTPL